MHPRQLVLSLYWRWDWQRSCSQLACTCAAASDRITTATPASTLPCCALLGRRHERDERHEEQYKGRGRSPSRCAWAGSPPQRAQAPGRSRAAALRAGSTRGVPSSARMRNKGLPVQRGLPR